MDNARCGCPLNLRENHPDVVSVTVAINCDQSLLMSVHPMHGFTWQALTLGLGGSSVPAIGEPSEALPSCSVELLGHGGESGVS